MTDAWIGYHPSAIDRLRYASTLAPATCVRCAATIPSRTEAVGGPRRGTPAPRASLLPLLDRVSDEHGDDRQVSAARPSPSMSRRSSCRSPDPVVPAIGAGN